MSASSDLRLHVLEHIGAPLLAAVVVAAPPDAQGAQDHAQILASLLAASVEAALVLSAHIEPAAADQDDILRLRLSALCAKLVAEYYTRQHIVPGEAEIKKLTAGLQTAIPFAENFKTALPSSSASHPLAVLSLISPVAEAMNTFAFGQPEAKLLTDTAEKLNTRALVFCESLGLSAKTDIAAHHHVLKALCALYAASHKAVTNQMLSAAPEKRTAPEAGLAAVWESFESRTAMLMALAQSLMPGTSAASAQGSASKAPEPPAAANEKPAAPAGNPMSLFAKKPDSPPAAESAPPLPAPEEKPAAPSPPASGTPMSFFKKKEG